MKSEDEGFRVKRGEVPSGRGLTRALLVAITIGQLAAPALGQVFTYQGRLMDRGNPANGLYDFQFTLADAATNGNYVAGSITKAGLTVSNGLFMAPLDFGAGVFDGSARW